MEVFYQKTNPEYFSLVSLISLHNTGFIYIITYLNKKRAKKKFEYGIKRTLFGKGVSCEPP